MHRTEVTEVTEGGLEVSAGNFCRGLGWPGCENLANEECIAQRSRRSQRGDLGFCGNFCRGHRWPACENPPNGKTSMILRFPARKQFHKTIFNASPDFPLCGLCAMLSSLRVVLARKRPLSTKQFPRDFLFNGGLGKSASEPRTLPVHYPRRPQSLPAFSPRS